MLIACDLPLSTPIESSAPSIASFEATPIGDPDGLGSYRYRLSWTVDDPDADVLGCKLDIDSDGSVDHEVSCLEDAFELTLQRGEYRATLTVDDGTTQASATTRMIAPANPPIANVELVLEVSTLADWSASEVALDPSGTRIAVVAPNGRGQIIEVATGNVLAMLDPFEHMRTPRWSPDGQLVAMILDVDVGFDVGVFDASTGGLRQRLGATDADAIAFSPDGARIAVGTFLRRLEIFHLTSGPERTLELVNPSDRHGVGVTDIAWGDTISVAIKDRVYIIAPETGRFVDTHLAPGYPKLDQDAEGSLVYARNHSVLAFATRGCTAPCNELRVDGGIYGVAWGPLAGKVALGLSTDTHVHDVRIIDLVWDSKLTLGRHYSAITSVSWSRDGRTVASSEADGRVLVWKLRYR